MNYSVIKHLHVAMVATSFALFALRAIWMITSPERLALRWVRVAPHFIDTVLLLSGGALAWQLGAGVRGWLPVKLLALGVYIVLGAVALRRGRSRKVRVACAVAAIVTFGYIVSVAVTKSPAGFLSF